MKRAWALGFAIVVLAGPALAAPQQFDLVCTGTVKDLLAHTEGPWSGRYAVDLDKQAYCTVPCGSPSPIAAVEPGRIVFEDVHKRGVVAMRTDEFSVDRVKGLLFRQATELSVSELFTRAQCEPAAFTPFPTTKF